MLKVLSIHWGYSIGGVGKYCSIIDHVGDYEDIDIKSICIVSKRRQVDIQTMEGLADKEIIWRKSLFDIKWFGRLKEIIDMWKPDCLMSHGFNAHFIALIARLLINRKQKIICSYHGLYHATTPMRTLPGYVYNRFTEFYINNIVISAVAVAEQCKSYLVTRGIPGEKVETIHNGIKDYTVPSEARNKYRRLFNVSDNEILIGVVSRIDPVKGIEYLVEAFAELAQSNNNIKMVIIGTGTVEVMLQDMCKLLKIDDRVLFAGFRDDIPDCLSAIDIFVLPSLAEYHSIGLLEAMRAEKAIVATDVGGNTESVRDNMEGLIVHSKNTDELVQAINELIENKKLASDLSKAARKRFLECFTEDVMVRRTAAWMIKSI